MKKKRTLYEWLTTDFRVSIRNDENFALKRDFRINYAKIIVFMATVFIAISALNFYLFSIAQQYLSNEGVKEKKYQQKLMHIHAQIDTLNMEIAKKDSFIKDIQRVVVSD